jgi:hypothetical protein
MTQWTVCQTFVLTPGMKVAVNQSVEQPPTNLANVIKSPNEYVYVSSHVIILPTCFHRFCDHHQGSFARVQRIQ